MKNPQNKVNQEIKKIKERMLSDLIPETNIPNSHAAKQIAKIDALAALEYAKSLNRPVLFIRIASLPRFYNPDKDENLLNSKEAAEILNMTICNFMQNRTLGKVNPEKKVGHNLYFTKEEIYRFAAERKQNSVTH